MPNRPSPDSDGRTIRLEVSDLDRSSAILVRSSPHLILPMHTQAMQTGGKGRDALASKEAFSALASARVSMHTSGAGELFATQVVELLSTQLARDLISQRLKSAPETTEALSQILEEPSGALDDGIRLLLSGRPAEAVQAMLQSAGDLKKYGVTIENGSDTGHPLWHACNPFFHLWRQAEHDPHVQSQWRDDPLPREGASLEASIQDFETWKPWAAPLVPVIKDLVAEIDQPSPVLLDLGCGHGFFTRLLQLEGALPAQALFGSDYHPDRIARAHELLSASDAGQFFTTDLLAETFLQTVHDRVRPDIITALMLTPCFDDDTIETVIARIANLGARYIVNVDTGSAWPRTNGRMDEPNLFAGHGYRMRRYVWYKAPLTATNRHDAALPLKAWPNQRLVVHERAD
ncbi:MAG: class I SAM-dependent methyltransferase [Rhodospirillaceae bacterium]|jgi:hypothetical protein|nr:class I SAM-dependent methyltransferase [Rhodospirillaceae bacterium]MBT6136954.1 class I SAM-dependent methyltransferase [Rhodospirillaceae bacterium]